MFFLAHHAVEFGRSRTRAVAPMLFTLALIAVALSPLRSGSFFMFIPATAALAISALSRRWGTPRTRAIAVLAFCGAAPVGCIAMFRPGAFRRIEPLSLIAQLVLGVCLVLWIVFAWRGRAKDDAPAVRWGRWTQLAVLAWLVLALRGCSADQMILGENHRAIRAPDARREVLQVDGRAVECWVTRSPAPGPPRATVLYFIGKGGRADQWVSAVAWSWKDRPIEVWAMNYPGSGGSAGPPRLDQI